MRTTAPLLSLTNITVSSLIVQTTDTKWFTYMHVTIMMLTQECWSDKI